MNELQELNWIEFISLERVRVQTQTEKNWKCEKFFFLYSRKNFDVLRNVALYMALYVCNSNRITSRNDLECVDIPTVKKKNQHHFYTQENRERERVRENWEKWYMRKFSEKSWVENSVRVWGMLFLYVYMCCTTTPQKKK